MGVCDDLLIAGTVATEQSDAVENVNMELNGDVAGTMMTSQNGFYSFDGLIENGDYTVTPMLDTDYKNGVTTYDLVLITKHILNLELHSIWFSYVS